MIRTELHTHDVPRVFAEFADRIGERAWMRRVKNVSADIKGRPLMKDLLHRENETAFTLAALSHARAKYKGLPLALCNDRSIYPAIAFCAQVLSILDGAAPAFARSFEARVADALDNPTNMRGLRLELTAATHFTRRGVQLQWGEMTGTGTFDLLADLGPNGLEVECKSIAPDTGCRITRTEAQSFFALLAKEHKQVIDAVDDGRLAVVTLDDRLPTRHAERQALAGSLARAIAGGQGAIDAGAARIERRNFDPDVLPTLTTGLHEVGLRELVDEITGTANRECMIVRTPLGGGVALALQSRRDDRLLDSMFRTLADSAKRQLTGTRPGLFLAALEGISDKDLRELALLDANSAGQATSLRIAVSNFLNGPGRGHVMGVGFLSGQGTIQDVGGNAVSISGSAYYFPRRESPMWSEAFSGLFNWTG